MTTVDITLSAESLAIARHQAELRQITVEEVVAEILTKIGRDALTREATEGVTKKT